MEVKIFLTADYANMDSSGKLNVLGAFTQIQSPNTPLILPNLHVVAQIEFDWSETGNHRIAFVKFYDPDGQELLAIASEFDLPKIAYGKTIQRNILLGIQGFPFEKFGTYEFKLFMEGNLITSIQVDVIQIQGN